MGDIKEEAPEVKETTKELKGDTRDIRGTGVRLTREDGTKTEKVTKDIKEEARQDMKVRRVTKEAQDGTKEELTKEAKAGVKRASHSPPSASVTASNVEARATWP